MTTVSPITTIRRTSHAAAPTAAQPAQAGVAHGARTTRTSFATGGGGVSVRQRFSTMEKRFKPAAAKGVNIKIQFKLSGSGGGEWYVVIKDGKCTVKEGTGPSPTATVSATASDYKKIADGEMNKMIAYLRGKLKIDGDKDVLKPFDTYFEKI